MSDERVKRRTVLACIKCNRSKAKCEHDESAGTDAPCRRCARLGFTCEFNQDSSRAKKKPRRSPSTSKPRVPRQAKPPPPHVVPSSLPEARFTRHSAAAAVGAFGGKASPAENGEEDFLSGLANSLASSSVSASPRVVLHEDLNFDTGIFHVVAEGLKQQQHQQRQLQLQSGSEPLSVENRELVRMLQVRTVVPLPLLREWALVGFRRGDCGLLGKVMVLASVARHDLGNVLGGGHMAAAGGGIWPALREGASGLPRVPRAVTLLENKPHSGGSVSGGGDSCSGGGGGGVVSGSSSSSSIVSVLPASLSWILSDDDEEGDVKLVQVLEEHTAAHRQQQQFNQRSTRGGGSGGCGYLQQTGRRGGEATRGGRGGGDGSEDPEEDEEWAVLARLGTPRMSRESRYSARNKGKPAPGTTTLRWSERVVLVKVVVGGVPSFLVNQNFERQVQSCDMFGAALVSPLQEGAQEEEDSKLKDWKKRRASKGEGGGSGGGGSSGSGSGSDGGRFGSESDREDSKEGAVEEEAAVVPFLHPEDGAMLSLLVGRLWVDLRPTTTTGTGPVEAAAGDGGSGGCDGDCSSGGCGASNGGGVCGLDELSSSLDLPAAGVRLWMAPASSSPTADTSTSSSGAHESSSSSSSSQSADSTVSGGGSSSSSSSRSRSFVWCSGRVQLVVQNNSAGKGQTSYLAFTFLPLGLAPQGDDGNNDHHHQQHPATAALSVSSHHHHPSSSAGVQMLPSQQHQLHGIPAAATAAAPAAAIAASASAIAASASGGASLRGSRDTKSLGVRPDLRHLSHLADVATTASILLASSSFDNDSMSFELNGLLHSRSMDRSSVDRSAPPFEETTSSSSSSMSISSRGGAIQDSMTSFELNSLLHAHSGRSVERSAVSCDETGGAGSSSSSIRGGGHHGPPPPAIFAAAPFQQGHPHQPQPGPAAATGAAMPAQWTTRGEANMGPPVPSSPGTMQALSPWM